MQLLSPCFSSGSLGVISRLHLAGRLWPMRARRFALTALPWSLCYGRFDLRPSQRNKQSIGR